MQYPSSAPSPKRIGPLTAPPSATYVQKYAWRDWNFSSIGTWGEMPLDKDAVGADFRRRTVVGSFINWSSWGTFSSTIQREGTGILLSRYTTMLPYLRCQYTITIVGLKNHTAVVNKKAIRALRRSSCRNFNIIVGTSRKFEKYIPEGNLLFVGDRTQDRDGKMREQRSAFIKLQPAHDTI